MNPERSEESFLGVQKAKNQKGPGPLRKRCTEKMGQAHANSGSPPGAWAGHVQMVDGQLTKVVGLGKCLPKPRAKRSRKIIGVSKGQKKGPPKKQCTKETHRQQAAQRLPLLVFGFQKPTRPAWLGLPAAQPGTDGPGRPGPARSPRAMVGRGMLHSAL